MVKAQEGAAPSLPWLIVGAIATGIAAALLLTVLNRSALALAPAPGGCRAPSEIQQLHVVYAWHDGRLVQIDCMHVSGSGRRR
jgi:hypothetical protein